ncbi:MAG: hypothetical protein OHK0019_31660 [Saprospiraceae bacterium]
MPGYSARKVQTTLSNPARQGSTGKTILVETFYDEKGRLETEERTDNIASATIRTEFGYDSILGQMNYILRTGGPTKKEAFAQYDEQGRLLEIVQCEEGNPCHVRHYAYDEDGGEQVFVPRQTIELQFGKGEKPKTLFGISAEDKLKDELARERFFDPEGNLEETRFFQNGIFTLGWIFEYEDGRKTKAWVYNDAEKKLSQDYEYDEEGRLMTEKTYLWVVGSKLMPYPETAPNVTRFEYDNKNRLIKTQQNTSASNKVQTFTYYEN